jgi:hypothetical protein
MMIKSWIEKYKKLVDFFRVDLMNQCKVNLSQYEFHPSELFEKNIKWYEKIKGQTNNLRETKTSYHIDTTLRAWEIIIKTFKSSFIIWLNAPHDVLISVKNSRYFQIIKSKVDINELFCNQKKEEKFGFINYINYQSTMFF